MKRIYARFAPASADPPTENLLAITEYPQHYSIELYSFGCLSESDLAQ